MEFKYSKQYNKLKMQNTGRMMVKPPPGRSVYTRSLTQNEREDFSVKDINSLKVTKMEIEGTVKTPEVHFRSGKIRISGRSILEDSSNFYRSLSDLLDDYSRRSGKISQIDLYFDYLNCNSTRNLATMLKELEKIYEGGNTFVINWYYCNDDESMSEVGHMMKSITRIPFNIISAGDDYCLD